MSHTVAPGRPGAAWEQRGYSDGDTGVKARPPRASGADAAAAYLRGFRRGDRSRRRRNGAA